MIKRRIPPSELIINEDGTIFHLHLRPEQLADRVVLVGDPARVDSIAQYLDCIECSVQNREFHTVTGYYQGKRLSIVSHGIGADNIDIVLNELDALVNIDFETREERDTFKQLTLVRIGTSGGLQDFTPIGTYVAAEHSIGFDGLMYFYQGSERIRNLDFERVLVKQLDWQLEGLRPYVVSADTSLLEQICTDTPIVRGCTIAANGFYAPQGRQLRLSLQDDMLNRKIQAFNWEGYMITNFEMESSALAGLSALLGHRALTVCCIIAGRKALRMNTSYHDSLQKLIDLVLTRI